MKSKLLVAGGAACVPLLLLAYSNGSPVRRTGQIDGGLDCSSCHRTFGAANSDARGSVAIEALQPYNPGVPQLLQITIRHPEAVRWGFQLTARFVTGNTLLKAGYFTPADSTTKVVCDNGSEMGSPGPCRSDQLEWIEHAQAQQTQSGAGSYTYAVQWQPPAEEYGDIVFYVSATAGDALGTAENERVYTASVRVPLSSTAGCSMTRPPVVRSAVNAGAHRGNIAPNAMVEIYGTEFQASSRSRQVEIGDLGSGRFPLELGCIAVEVGGARAPVTYVRPDQINIQAPATLAAGPTTLVVIANPGRANELRSATLPVTVENPAPSFFTFGTSGNIAAQFANTTNVAARPAVVPGARPAKPGETLVLYGTGFGATTPAWSQGEIPNAISPTNTRVTVTIGGQNATVLYAGVSPGSISGLYQVNVVVPDSVPDGDQPVVATVGGATTQSGAFLPIQR